VEVVTGGYRLSGRWSFSSGCDAVQWVMVGGLGPGGLLFFLVPMAEVTIVLKPKSQWRPGLDWDGLIKQMDEKLHFPGLPNIWWMPIQTRTEMLATGVRSPLGIEVFGDDLDTIESAAIAVEHAVKKIPGTRSAFAERSTGGFYVDVEIKREEAARHGLTALDVNMVVAQAVGGENISETVEGHT